MKTHPSFLILFLSIVLCAGCASSCRTVCGDLSDQFEPNDTLEQATALEFGTPIDAGSHYGNIDFYKTSVEQPATLTFRVDSRDVDATNSLLEVRGPAGELIYTDVCPSGQLGCAPTLPASKTKIRNDEDTIVGYEIVVSAEDTGDYSIAIQASGSDHSCKFSWEYTVTVTHE